MNICCKPTIKQLKLVILMDMEERKDTQRSSETNDALGDDKTFQDQKAFIEEWRMKLQEIESTLAKDSPEILKELGSFKETIDTLQLRDSSSEDFLKFYQKLTCASFFSKYNQIKINNQSEFIRKKTQMNEDVHKCSNLHKLLRSSISIDELKVLLDRLLLSAADLDKDQAQILLNSVFRDIEGFEYIEISTNLGKEEMSKVREMLIDFIYQFKDKRPRLQSKGAFDVFNQVMDFVCKHRLKPSIELQEKYSKTELNELLRFPSYEFLKEKIDMEDDVYNDLKKVYDSIGHFNYFFDSNIPLKTIPIEEDDFKGVEISHRTDDTNKCYGAGINIFSDGQVFQGYFKNDERYLNGRLFWPDGEYHYATFINTHKTGYLERISPRGLNYHGSCVDGDLQGKGLYNFDSETILCSEYRINNFHGPGIYYNSNGKIEICMFKDDRRLC